MEQQNIRKLILVSPTRAVRPERILRPPYPDPFGQERQQPAVFGFRKRIREPPAARQITPRRAYRKGSGARQPRTPLTRTCKSPEHASRCSDREVLLDEEIPRAVRVDLDTGAHRGTHDSLLDVAAL